MTIRLSSILWIVLLVAGAVGLYMVKYKVQSVKAEVALAEKQLSEEKRNIHVLNAEWTYLTRPERIKVLSAKYLDIKPMQGQQIVEFSSLPQAKPDTSSNYMAKQDSTLSPASIKFVRGGPANEDYHDE